MMGCARCGAELTPGDHYRKNCGKDLRQHDRKTENVDVSLLNEKRTGHVSLMTKEDWKASEGYNAEWMAKKERTNE